MNENNEQFIYGNSGQPVDLQKNTNSPYNSSFAPPPQNNGAFPQQQPQNNGYVPPPPLNNSYNVPPQPPKKKSSCLVIAIIGILLAVLVTVVVVIAVILLIFLRKGDDTLSTSSHKYSSKPSSSVSSVIGSSSESSDSSSSSESIPEPADTDYSPAIKQMLDNLDSEAVFYTGTGDSVLEWAQFDLDSDNIPEVVVSCETTYEEGYSYKYGQLYVYNGEEYEQAGHLFSLPLNDSSYPHYDAASRTLLSCSSDGSSDYYIVLSYSDGYIYTKDTLFSYASVGDFNRSDAQISEKEFNRLVDEYTTLCSDSVSYTRFKTIKGKPVQKYIGEATIETEKDPLNMRSGPGKEYDVTFKVPKGALVYVRDVDFNWAYVDYITDNGEMHTGYVSTEYLSITRYSD